MPKLNAKTKKQFVEVFEAFLDSDGNGVPDLFEGDKAKEKGISSRFQEWGTLAQVGVFVAILVGGAFIVYFEIPDREEMQTQIHDRVAPVDELAKKNAEAIHAIQQDMGQIKKDVSRTKEVQDVLLEQNAYDSEVLRHLAEGKKGTPPEKPKSLELKELELMR